jgi:L-rhamnose isomerase/sugar isomerase
LAGKIAKELAVGLITLWLPDGSNYPGQIDLRLAIESLKQSLKEISARMDKDVNVLIEYKVFEPGTYSSLLPDWGSAFLMAKSFGSNAGVLVDLGHHFFSTNIEQIVARLIAEDMKGGFHFNTRYAADDDHAVEPNPELARIFYELISGNVIGNKNPEKNWAFMIDQCSGRENRNHAILQSVDSIQLSLAKALLVDREHLQRLQKKDEIILANRFFNNALIHADVRPIVAAARLEKNQSVDPVKAYVESGYQQKIEAERK